MVNNSKTHPGEDTQLMLKVAEGDCIAYERLYRKYYPIVTDYIASCNGDVAWREDLAQQVFLRIWQNKERFRGQSSSKTYIFGIAKNVLREHRRYIQRCIVGRNLSGLVSNFPRSEKPLERGELADAIKLAKSKLSEKERQALELSLYSGVSHLEAAKLEGCSYQAFRRRLYDAKKHLVALLEKLRVY